MISLTPGRKMGICRQKGGSIELSANAAYGRTCELCRLRGNTSRYLPYGWSARRNGEVDRCHRWNLAPTGVNINPLKLNEVPCVEKLQEKANYSNALGYQHRSLHVTGDVHTTSRCMLGSSRRRHRKYRRKWVISCNWKFQRNSSPVTVSYFLSIICLPFKIRGEKMAAISASVFMRQ